MDAYHHVLVVHDNYQGYQHLRALLKLYGMRVTGISWDEQLEQVSTGDWPSVAILDASQSVETSLDIWRRTSLTGVSPVPTLILLEGAHALDGILALELGADDYLLKPFSVRELIAKIKALLRRTVAIDRHGFRTNIQAYHFCSWSLVVGNRRLSHADGTVVNLSQGEMSLLRVFLDHANHVISREQLLIRTRGRTYIRTDRSIDVLISRLRRRLSSGIGKSPLIQTHWGKGYVLSANVNVITDRQEHQSG